MDGVFALVRTSSSGARAWLAQVTGEHDGRGRLARLRPRAGCRGRSRRRAPARRARGRASGGSSDSRGTRSGRRASTRAARALRSAWDFGTGRRRAIELVRHRPDALEHRREIGDGLAHVFERGVQPALELARLRLVARPVDLDESARTRCATSRRSAPITRSVAARVAPHRQHRMHDQMHGDVHLAEDDADRIDEERHVGRHHAHQRAMRGGRGVAIERRRDVDEHAVAGARAAELEVRERRRGEIRRAMRAQVFFGDAAEVAAQEIARQRSGVRAARSSMRARLSFR